MVLTTMRRWSTTAHGHTRVIIVERFVCGYLYKCNKVDASFYFNKSYLFDRLPICGASICGVSNIVNQTFLRYRISPEREIIGARKPTKTKPRDASYFKYFESRARVFYTNLRDISPT